MERKDFFDFSSKFVSSIVQAHPFGLNMGENGPNDHRNLIKGLYTGIDFPVIFKQEYGNKLTDVLDTGCVSLYLISDRMKTILEENDLKGWITFPIKLFNKKNNEISGYWGLSIIGRCGPISYEKSEIIEKQMVPTGPTRKFYKGESIDLDNWDGIDFFIPEKTIAIFVTERAPEIFKKHNLTNIRLENLNDVETDMRYVTK